MITNRFDQHAASWDAKEFQTRLAANVASAIRNGVTLNDRRKVLDFGCGTGLISMDFAPEVGTLTGVDTSAGMLDVFREKAEKLNYRNVTGILTDLQGEARLTESYDLILSSMTFHHIPDVPQLLRTLFEMLNHGGKLFVADLDPDQGLFHNDNTGVHHFGFDREILAGYFKKAGFNRVSVETATRVKRTREDGIEREFSVFLISGEKD